MITSQTNGARCTITLNRPDKANALTAEMLEMLERRVGEAEGAGVPVLILTGAGKVFSAGADLQDVHNGLTTNAVWERLSTRIARYPGLTIAALNGTCAGGALGMMLACDLRVAVDKAKVFYPVLKNGFLPQPSDPRRLAALCGLSRAKMILLGGQKVDAQTALSWGLFDALATPDDLLEVVTDLSADAVNANPTLLAQIKALCHGDGPRRAMPGPAPAPAQQLSPHPTTARAVFGASGLSAVAAKSD
ncbi:enoyl-CoA hydratase/isomerase family protein [Tropicimonas sp. S265A]|uniref:enoyl-CoA hydratase/isomerase family protein n=1 Tax=Tropicimonas sp. S265A TaxID=3415134 RepID=UPI003C7A953F